MPIRSAAAVAVSPSLVHAALLCIAEVEPIDPHDIDDLLRVARALGCRPFEAYALAVRLRAAFDLFDDPRLARARHIGRSDAAEHGRFDRRLAGIVARQRLDASQRFEADRFFDDLLDRLAIANTPAACANSDRRGPAR